MNLQYFSLVADDLEKSLLPASLDAALAVHTRMKAVRSVLMRKSRAESSQKGSLTPTKV